MTDTTHALKAERRETTGKQVKQLRADGKVPAVLYGFQTENTNLVLDAKSFRRLYNEAGGSTLISLEVAGQSPVKILIQDAQLDPVTDEPIHVDLFAVNLKEEVETAVPLAFVGESPAVEEQDGNLVTNLTELEIKTLPTNIPSEIEVDISVLKTFEDQIRVSDIKAPGGVEVLVDGDVMVAFVEEPRSEEELAAELADTSDAEKAAVEELGKEPEKAEDGASDEKSE
ncbi:MAG: 50S ribosomal protein L25 [Patescibacteria group bacterium]|jgi:large subunit ribosomal protein L25